MKNKKTYVAIVDDDESFARAIGRLLRASGFEVDAYSSAEAFLASTLSPQLDCLLLDIHLGGMSGLELQRRLRESDAAVPIIFVTANNETGWHEEARQGGCAGYLRKPVAKA